MDALLLIPVLGTFFRDLGRLGQAQTAGYLMQRLLLDENAYEQGRFIAKLSITDMCMMASVLRDALEVGGYSPPFVRTFLILLREATNRISVLLEESEGELAARADGEEEDFSATPRHPHSKPLPSPFIIGGFINVMAVMHVWDARAWDVLTRALLVQGELLKPETVTVAKHALFAMAKLGVSEPLDLREQALDAIVRDQAPRKMSFQDFSKTAWCLTAAHLLQDSRAVAFFEQARTPSA